MHIWEVILRTTFLAQHPAISRNGKHAAALPAEDYLRQWGTRHATSDDGLAMDGLSDDGDEKMVMISLGNAHYDLV